MITDRDVTRANKLLKRLFPKESPFKLETIPGENYQELTSEPLDLLIYFGDIFPDANPYLQQDGYIVQGIVHYPGVRYYKDGSGEPPMDETIDLETFTDFNSALDYLLEKYFQTRLGNLWMDIIEEELEESERVLEENRTEDPEN